MSPEEESTVGGWGGERGRKEAASFPPCSPSPPGISRVGKEQGGPASPCPATYMLWSPGNSLPVSEPAPRFLLPGPGPGLLPPGSVQGPGQTEKRERKGVTHALAPRGAAGFAALLRAVQPLATNAAPIPRWMSAQDFRQGDGRGAQGPCGGLGVEGPPGRQGSEERRGQCEGRSLGGERGRISRFREEREEKRERE